MKRDLFKKRISPDFGEDFEKGVTNGDPFFEDHKELLSLMGAQLKDREQILEK